MARTRARIEADIAANREGFDKAAAAVMADPRLSRAARKQDIETGHQVVTERHQALMREREEAFADEKAALWGRAFDPFTGQSAVAPDRRALHSAALDRGLSADKAKLPILMEIACQLGDSISSAAFALVAHRTNDHKTLEMYAAKWSADDLNALTQWEAARADNAGKLHDKIEFSGPQIPSGYADARPGEV